MRHTGLRQRSSTGALPESWLLADRERSRRLAYPRLIMGLVEFGFEEMEDSNDK